VWWNVGLISVKIKDGKILSNKTASKPKLGVEIRKLVGCTLLKVMKLRMKSPVYAGV
jgi:hypothetical protein